MRFDIPPAVQRLQQNLQARLNDSHQSVGALGILEQLALRVDIIQNTPTPRLQQPTLVVCAADHGTLVEGISALPADSSARRVRQILDGRATINQLTRTHGLNLLLVDAGVAHEPPADEQLYDARIAAGTANYVQQPAMTREQCQQALTNGIVLIDRLADSGCTVVGFGDIGTGNAGSAALLMSVFCQLPLERCIGQGGGLDTTGVYRKIRVLKRARERLQSNQALRDPLTALTEFGGFEIVTLCGSMLRAAERGMVILIDGFASTAALLAARAFNPHVLDYCIASHRSAETGHSLMLQQLRARPLLDLQLRASEGVGATLAYPLLKSAVALLQADAPAVDTV